MATADPKRKPHDMGGDPAGPIDSHEHTPTLVERRIDAMMQLLRQKPRAFWVTDENRRTIESLTPETYRDSGYYQKWCLAMRSLLVEKGVLSDAEIDAKLAEVKARHAAAAKAPAKAAKPARKKPAAKAAAAAPKAKAKAKTR
ncbi:MAG: hypothetical protein AB7F78_08475 [Hyphomicrobiaceae bacterium]